MCAKTFDRDLTKALDSITPLIGEPYRAVKLFTGGDSKAIHEVHTGLRLEIRDNMRQARCRSADSPSDFLDILRKFAPRPWTGSLSRVKLMATCGCFVSTSSMQLWVMTTNAKRTMAVIDFFIALWDLKQNCSGAVTITMTIRKDLADICHNGLKRA